MFIRIDTYNLCLRSLFIVLLLLLLFFATLFFYTILKLIIYIYFFCDYNHTILYIFIPVMIFFSILFLCKYQDQSFYLLFYKKKSLALFFLNENRIIHIIDFLITRNRGSIPVYTQKKEKIKVFTIKKPN